MSELRAQPDANQRDPLTAPGHPRSTPQEPAVLEVSGLHRFFRRGGQEIAALKDVSLQVFAGDMIAVRGASGSGKSTLLAMIAGLDRPDAGEVRVDGLVSNDRTSAPGSDPHPAVAVMLAGGGLIEHLSLAANLSAAARLRGQKPDRQLLDSLGIGARRHARPSQLSGGELARAGLAVALSAQPRVLLADEPTGELSRGEEAEVLELLRCQRPAGGVSVVVTHSEQVAQAADRVIELSAGRIVAGQG